MGSRSSKSEKHLEPLAPTEEEEWPTTKNVGAINVPTETVPILRVKVKAKPPPPSPSPIAEYDKKFVNDWVDMVSAFHETRQRNRCTQIAPPMAPLRRELSSSSTESYSTASASAHASLLPSGPLPSNPNNDLALLTCTVCNLEPPNTVFVCGHISCESCAKKLTICHVCQNIIRSRIRLAF